MEKYFITRLTKKEELSYEGPKLSKSRCQGRIASYFSLFFSISLNIKKNSNLAVPELKSKRVEK